MGPEPLLRLARQASILGLILCLGVYVGVLVGVAFSWWVYALHLLAMVTLAPVALAMAQQADAEGASLSPLARWRHPWSLLRQLSVPARTGVVLAMAFFLVHFVWWAVMVTTGVDVPAGVLDGPALRVFSAGWTMGFAVVIAFAPALTARRNELDAADA